MTLLESGIIAGAATGAIMGILRGAEYGGLGVAGGFIAGGVAGAIAGWAYAYVVMVLLAVVGVLWRATRKRANEVPAESDIARMTPPGIAGVTVGILGTAACAVNIGWPHALAAAAAVAAVTAVVAIARCELTR